MAGNNNDDPTWILVILLAIVGGVCWGVWHFFKMPILEALRYLRLVEIAPLALFDTQASACFTWLRTAQVNAVVPTQEAYQASLGCFGVTYLTSLPSADRLSYYNLSGPSIAYVSTFVGSYMRWIVVGVAGYVAYNALFISDRNNFKTRHTLESFIKAQAKIWKVIAPIVGFNPAKHSARAVGEMVPEKLPLFAEALAPEEWLAFHEIPVVKGIPSRELVHQALYRQLGPHWNGDYDSLPMYIQALLAAFALKGVQKRDESDDLLGRISECWSAGHGIVFPPAMVAEIKKTLKASDVGGKALPVAGKHAYRSTAVMGVLRWARVMGGVLASAQFLWLRGVDRELWYALNNLGRRSFHSEGAGAITHFMAEEIANKALVVPRFETAIMTLNKYISDNQITLPPREAKVRA